MLFDANRDEFGRQRALESLDILDTPQEQPFEKIIDLVKRTLSVPVCGVSLIDKDRQWFKASRGLSVSETPRDVSFCTHAITGPEPFVIVDATIDERFAKNPLVIGEPHIRSYLGIPLTMPDGYSIGSLCAIDTKVRHFAEHEISILDGFAKVIVDQIDLRQTASTDALTGTMCRAAWFNMTIAELARSRRHDRPLSLLVLDIDHFKSINDRFGHSAGDAVLRQFAQVTGDELRQSDHFGRFGGEEFVVALSETGADEAMTIAERMRALIEHTHFSVLGEARCTVSIGVAELLPEDRSLAVILERADKALYRAKANGRNRVESAAKAHEKGASRSAA